eukprot:CAMPEP_0172447396 /NCGR_PEP_ID=MMETSP1065-20121228/6714_1 /TAXON_ID=265537 /ORGANISM="Amphiprora paludosa, Strain CCMP125" /LENGTH=368 /DNA_ID=CAMNT_0013198693 /DNA_START=189 /DNA_END=1292 /DNA_ORIENTATION=+
MNPRKRSKRHRHVPHRLRLPPSNGNGQGMDVDEEEWKDEAANEREELADNVKAMVRQESDGSYTCADYLSMTVWGQSVDQLLKKPNMTLSSRYPVGNSRIDEYCREQIVEWSFRVVDYFRIDREVVAVSLSYLDRFLATCHCDRTSFKLAATTTLYLAVKILYPCKLVDLGILSDLSRGEFDMADVCEMETHILRSLSWKLHPPTSVAFVSLFLDYFFYSRDLKLSHADCDDIYDVASFFSELAVCDYFFVTLKSSTTALAAVLNALEGMFGPENHLSTEIISVARTLHIAPNAQDLAASRSRLWELYERSEECALHSETKHVVEEDQSNIFVKKATQLSPVSVSKPCHSASDFVCPSHTTKLRNGSW